MEESEAQLGIRIYSAYFIRLNAGYVRNSIYLVILAQAGRSIRRGL